MSELKKIPVILDGDPGHDDAIGWTLAQGSGRFDILAYISREKTADVSIRISSI